MNERFVDAGDRRRVIDDVFGLIAGEIRGDATERRDDRDQQTRRGDTPIADHHSDQQQKEREERRVKRRVVDGQMDVNEVHFFVAVSAARFSVASRSACALIGGL